MAAKTGNISIDRAIHSLKGLPMDQQKALVFSIKYYYDKLSVRHFQAGNTGAYGYPGLSAKYKKRKRKKWGNKPQLVASGRLKKSAETSVKVQHIKNKRIAVRFRVPNYGQYQIAAGRDWIKPNKRDIRDIKRKYYDNLKKIRKNSKSKR